LSIFKVKVVACNPKDGKQMTLPVEALVDTSSDLTWLPAGMLRGIGITARQKRFFAVPNKLMVEREVGSAVLQANGHNIEGDVVFAEPGDPLILGVRALEGFGVTVEAQRFVPITALATFSMEEKTPVQKVRTRKAA
jgi:hypothetical protein